MPTSMSTDLMAILLILLIMIDPPILTPNPLTAKLIDLNFHPLEVVSR